MFQIYFRESSQAKFETQQDTGKHAARVHVFLGKLSESGKQRVTSSVLH